MGAVLLRALRSGIQDFKCWRRQDPLKKLGLILLVLMLVSGGLIARVSQQRPCQAARAVFEGYSDVSGYSTVQDMLAGDFRYLGASWGHHKFFYRKNDAVPSRVTKERAAVYREVSIGIFGRPSYVRSLTTDVSEFDTSEGRPCPNSWCRRPRAEPPAQRSARPVVALGGHRRSSE